jgi:hypothetical protein
MLLVETGSVRTINRDEEVGEATQRLDQMLNDIMVPEAVLFFFGVPTVGKTTILQSIDRRAASLGVPRALIDFDRHPRSHQQTSVDEYQGDAGRIRIIERMIAALSRTGQFTPTYAEDRYLDRVDQAITRLMVFARELYRANRNKPFLLMFDTIEECDPQTLLWLQQEILVPFLNEFYTLVVIAGRTEPNTTRRDLIYPIERRTLKIQVKPFDEEKTEQQILAIGARDMRLSGSKLASYTSGLPGLNEAAVRWMHTAKRNMPGPELRAYLVEEIIFEQRLADVVPYVKSRLLAVTPLRQFDSGLLGRVIVSIFPKDYESINIRVIRELLRRLQETRMVESHPDGYGYVIPRDIRMTLDDYWRNLQPNDHIQVHQIAARWFAEQVEQGDFVAIADRLYHLCGLARDLHERPKLDANLDAELQSDPGSLARLTTELRDALKRLADTSPRAFD